MAGPKPIIHKSITSVPENIRYDPVTEEFYHEDDFVENTWRNKPADLGPQVRGVENGGGCRESYLRGRDPYTPAESDNIPSERGGTGGVRSTGNNHSPFSRGRRGY